MVEVVVFRFLVVEIVFSFSVVLDEEVGRGVELEVMVATRERDVVVCRRVVSEVETFWVRVWVPLRH